VDFFDLTKITIDAFAQELPKNFKFFYIDSEGDLISLTCQEDLDEALDSMAELRLFIEENIELARSYFNADLSIKDSLNLAESPA
jgi:PB1 domain-containing protein